MKYAARISKNGDSSYAVIVMIHGDGFEQVIHGYKGRHFATEKAAIRSTAKYLAAA